MGAGKGVGMLRSTGTLHLTILDLEVLSRFHHCKNRSFTKKTGSPIELEVSKFQKYASKKVVPNMFLVS